MIEEYVVARRRKMIIRIVKPEQFIHRTVEERRPLSFVGDMAHENESDRVIYPILGIALCLVMLSALAYGIASGFASVFSALLY